MIISYLLKQTLFHRRIFLFVGKNTTPFYDKRRVKLWFAFPKFCGSVNEIRCSLTEVNNYTSHGTKVARALAIKRSPVVRVAVNSKSSLAASRLFPHLKLYDIYIFFARRISLSALSVQNSSFFRHQPILIRRKRKEETREYGNSE